MLQMQPNKGDLIKLPQGVVAYRLAGKQKQENQQEFNLVFAEHIQKPTIAIYLEQYTDNVSKIVYEDKIIYVYTEFLYEIGGVKDAR